MENTIFSTEALINSLKTNKFIQYSSIVMGYVPGLPILTVLNGNLCLKVPYLKYKVTGEVDKTFVYPIKYVVTISIPEGTIIGFEDLSFNKSYINVAFGSPVGTFRHDAIKNLDKKAYSNLRSILFTEYDKIVNHLAFGKEYSFDDEKHFKALLNVVLEPSLIPFYSIIDNEFASRYITNK